MERTVYELRKAHIELKNKSMIYEGITVNQDCFETDLIETFDSKEKALDALELWGKSFTSRGTSNLVIFEEAFVEVAEYDEDGEWVGGGDIVKFSEWNGGE